MFSTEEDDSRIKLIDFGLSRTYFTLSNEEKGELDIKLTKMKTRAGTPFFMAPEVIYHCYSEACDMWSAGVMLYIMLCGYPPFYGENDREILEAVCNGHYDFDDEVWDEVSESAKDLINNLLVSEKKRMSAKDAIQHKWIKEYESKSFPGEERYLSSKNIEKL